MMPTNAILRTRAEIGVACDAMKANGLTVPDDTNKCWDEWKAFQFITGHGDAASAILDVGTHKCRILEALYVKGYKNLYGCDLAPAEWRRRIYPYLFNLRFGDLVSSFLGKPPIQLSVQDLCRTVYPSGRFDFITSLSVIEHGVTIVDYFQEMGRLLKLGGYLITSIDYWPDHIDTEGVVQFGLPWKVFSQRDISKIVAIAEDFGLRLAEPLDLVCGQPIIEWNGRRYTFLLFVLRKEGKA
jgi:SAM-dependent methyltransferase